MSDLISRSELLKRFLVNKDGHRIPERDCDNFEVTISIKDVKAIIKEQPTAYDIDKVIEELNELDVKSITRYKNGNFGNFDGVEYYIKKRKAIEIVKQGGVGTESKTIRENANGYSKEDIELNRNAMYNKAIDDFVERLKETYKPCKEADNYIYTIVCRRFDDIAQQLKAGDDDA